MPTLPFIDTDDDKTIDGRNDLWKEFDRKLTVLHGGKSFLLTPGGSFGLSQYQHLVFRMGYQFYWGSNHNQYNHAAFESAIAAATVLSTDEEKKIVTVSHMSQNGLLFGSLEAHKKDGYWILESGQVVAEHRHKWAVAELIIDGPTEFSFPAKYDKYQCFRIHNLGSAELTFQFEGGPTYVIPAYGIQSVRRTLDGVYDAPMKYFWPFQHKDPRFYRWINGEDNEGSTTSTYDPSGSMVASNICNPGMIFRMVYNLFSQTPTGFRSIGQSFGWIINRRSYFSMASLYAGLFGDIADTETKLGDVLHHKGKLRVFYVNPDGSYEQSDVDFKGHKTLVADFAAVGLTVVINPDETLKITSTDGRKAILAGYGTNLTTPNVIAEIQSGLTLSEPTDGYTIPQLKSVPIQVFGSWQNLNGTPESVSFNVTVKSLYTNYDFISPELSRSIHKRTIGQILSLNAFGPAEYSSLNQNNTANSWTNREAVLSLFGPIFIYDQVIPLNSSISGSSGFATGGYIYAGDYSLSDTNIVRQHSMTWQGYGYPTPEDPHFLSPRLPRSYSALSGGFFKVDGYQFEQDYLKNDPSGPDGADIEYIFSPSYFKSQITTMAKVSPWTGANLKNPRSVTQIFWKTPDLLYSLIDGFTDANLSAGIILYSNDFRYSNVMPRVYLLREFHNSMCAAVNAITAVCPNIWDNGLANSIGVNGSSFRPKNQYASFGLNDSTFQAFQALGVPIKTIDDLPSSYAAVKNATQGNVGVLSTGTWSSTDIQHIVPPFPDPDYYHIKSRVDVSKTIVRGEHSGNIEEVNGGQEGAPGSVPLPVINAPPFSMTSYYWVTIEDVKAAVEARGYIFFYTEQSLPYDLKIFRPSSLGTVVDNFPQGFDLEHDAANFPVPASFSFTFKSYESLGTDAGAFVQSGSLGAEWKATRNSAWIADVRSSDDYPIVYGTGNFFGPGFPGYPVEYPPSVYTVPYPEELLREIRVSNPAGYERNVLFQFYSSFGSATVLRTPLPWLGAASRPFTTNMATALASNTAHFPLKQFASASSASTQLIVATDTIISPPADGCEEINFFVSKLIPV